jgi:hypothetical protein
MTKDSAISIDIHSTEVVHFTHTIWILTVWASSPHRILCHDKHPLKAFCLPTLVHVLTLWSIPPRQTPTVYLLISSVTLGPRRENPSVFRMGSLLAGPLHFCLPLATTRIPGLDDPYIVIRLPILKSKNYRLSPILYQGNVVAREKLVWQTLIRNAFFLNPSSPFYLFNSIFLKPHF